MKKCPVCKREARGKQTYNGIPYCGDCFETMFLLEKRKKALEDCLISCISGLDQKDPIWEKIISLVENRAVAYHIEFKNSIHKKGRPKNNLAE